MALAAATAEASDNARVMQKARSEICERALKSVRLKMGRPFRSMTQPIC